MRTNPYPMNDPKDYSMLTQPKLRLNDTVIVWDEEGSGEWVQARVVDATFNRGKKCWEYSAVVEFVDDYREGYEKKVRIAIKDWYCFSDDELERPLIDVEDCTMGKDMLNHYIVIRK